MGFTSSDKNKVGVRAWPHAVISSLGARARGGVVRLRRSVSHVVGHGHLLTSGWVPLGPVKARRGSSGTRMGPYLSRTPIRVHRVIRQGSSGPVGTYRPHRPKFGQVQKHQIWSEMGRESTVWPETWSRGMPGPFRSLWDELRIAPIGSKLGKGTE